MPLKAKPLEKKEKRLKLFLYGPAGVGKTTAAIQFPNAVIIDMEKGTENYQRTITKAESIVLQTTSPDDVKNEIKTLINETHPYKTLIIDPVTSLYNATQEKWSRIFERYATNEKQAQLQDFGMRYWGRVKSDYKAIQRLLMTLDMNVIVTSHQKDIYGAGMQKVGVGPDSMKGDDYFFDYVFQLVSSGGKRIANTIKERAEIGGAKFPEQFEWSYENFLRFYGSEIIEKRSVPLQMATEDQIEEIKKLLDIVKIDEDTITKWFTKADCSDWSEMDSKTIEKCIIHIRKQLKKLTIQGEVNV